MLVACLTLVASQWSLLLAGDVMLNGVRPSAKAWSGIATVVRSADLAIANLEVPWTKATKPTPVKTAEELKARSQFVLKADPAQAKYFASAGWDAVSIGNNHMMDFAEDGLRETRALLTEQSVVFAGAGSNLAEASAPAIYVLEDGTKVGLLSAMAFQSTKGLSKTSPAKRSAAGVHGLDLGGALTEKSKKRLADWIKSASKRCDVLVVGFHWGVEKKTVPNPYQVALGRAAIDAGASIVWGHHPHVLQGAELYRGRPIFYSTGNLISALPGNTALFELVFQNKRLSGIRVRPAKISGGAVSLVSGKALTDSLSAFRTLCRSVQQTYPNRLAAMPTLL
jgi:poly-gamma-glutamate synthesis protein (capsule biosynthesis protein)